MLPLIQVIEQREALRVLSKGKDKDSRGEQTESLCNSILSKMIKEILASEQATAIVDDILDQQPRLYCFFDTAEAIKVNNLRKGGVTSESLEHMQVSQRIEPESAQQSMRVSTNVINYPQEGTIEEVKGSIDERRESSDVERQTSGQNRTDRSVYPDRLSRQESAKSHTERDEQIRTRVLNVPTHLTPQDIIPESEQEDRKESQLLDEQQVDRSIEVSEDENLKKLLIKNEFKAAAQTVFDDIFLSLIKESVAGGLNLNEKQVRSSTRAHKHTLTKMRSYLSQGQQQLSVSNLKP